MSSEVEAVEAEDVGGNAARRRLREALSSFLTEDEVRALIAEALAVRKTVSVECTHCRKQTRAEILDARSVTQSLASLLELAAGKLGTQSPDAAGGVTLVRKIVYGCENCPCDACRTQLGANLAERPLAGAGLWQPDTLDDEGAET